MKQSQPFFNKTKLDDLKPMREREPGVILEDLLSSFCEMKQSHLYDLPNWALDQG